VADKTIIAWTDKTFNIAWGCLKISPGCAHCYAETLSTRFGESVWGPTNHRRIFGAQHWAAPLKWNRDAEQARRRARVFSSSMCDNFEDHPDITSERAKLWPLIRQTPWLDWQLLTKRAERIADNLPADWGDGYPNVWMGVSVENQEYADERIPLLLKLPAAVRFISYEPALGPVNLSAFLTEPTRLDWVICGGESGPGYRPMDVQWARDVRNQCHAAGVAFFFKQSAAPRTEMGIQLDGEIVREYPTRLITRH